MVTSIIHSYKKVSVVDKQYLKASFLNRIREINKKHRHVYGDLVVCCEGGKNWRKQYFQFYKAHRKQGREDSYLNWNLILEVMNEVRDDIIIHFPYAVMQVAEAEGDDIIAALARIYNQQEKILIFSGDNDFAQLQRYSNIDQYSPITQKMIKPKNPILDLKEKIIRGDSGDGVPNILSKDNIFLLEDERQNSISSAKLKVWLTQEPDVFCTNDTMKRNWVRNKTLIDLESIPEDLCRKILDEYDLQLNRPKARKDGLIDYFANNGLVNFISSIQDF